MRKLPLGESRTWCFDISIATSGLSLLRPGTSLLHFLWLVRKVLEHKGPKDDYALTHEKHVGTKKP